jgi:hypothetical protein
MLPLYNQLKQAQGSISGEHFQPIIVDNVLTEQQIDYLYKAINTNEEHLQGWFGRKSWMINDLPLDIVYQMSKTVALATQKQVFLDESPFFLKYYSGFGYEPKLAPHYDNRPSQRLTLDIQLNYDEEWAVVVEEKPFTLKYNQGLIFYGTQQMHWREKKVLKPNTTIDMFIANFTLVPDKPLDKNQLDIMEARSMHLMSELNIDNRENKIL